jgi:hypothetical protein
MGFGAVGKHVIMGKNNKTRLISCISEKGRGKISRTRKKHMN